MAAAWALAAAFGLAAPAAAAGLGEALFRGDLGTLLRAAVLLALPLFAGLALARTARWWRTGDLVLELRAAPPRPGETLDAILRTGLTERPAAEVEATLACIADRLSGRRRGRRAVLWQDVRFIPPVALTYGSRGYDVPVQVALPAEAPARPEGFGEPRWRLTLSIPLASGTEETSFDVPVAGATGAVEWLGGAVPGGPGPARKAIAIGTTESGSLSVAVGPLRHPRAALVMGTGAIFFAALADLAFALSGSLLLAAPAIGLAALLGYGAADLVLRETHVLADALGVRVRSGWLGWGRRIEVPREQIRDVRAERRGKRRPDAAARLFDVLLFRDGGRPLPLAERLTDEKAAWKIARAIARALGR